MSTVRISRVSPRLIVIAVLAGAAISGCGSTGHPSRTTATSNDHALGVRFASCMRDHGVPSFPDPETSAGIQIPVSLAKNPSPAFKSAMQACHYLMAAEGSPPVVSASQKAAAVKLAQCMRKHGVPNYPDPTYQNGQLDTAVYRGPRDKPRLTSVLGR